MQDSPAPPARPKPRKRVWPILLVVLILLALVFVVIPGMLSAMRKPDVHPALQSLLTIRSAQAAYHSDSRLNAGNKGYWRTDVAGLYGSKGSDGQPMKQIDLSVALADDRPRTDLSEYGPSHSKNGYRFRCVLYADEKSPDGERFAIFALPEDIDGTRPLFLVTEKGELWRRKPATPADIPDQCPADPRADGWEKLD